jgi:hypothetical protein
MRTFDRLERQLVAAVLSERPQVPEAGRLLWQAFITLHAARTITMAGAQAITYAEIEAFGRTSRLPLRPRHVAILRAMDDAWLAKVRAVEPGRSSPPPQHPRQEITPAVFDAVFG